MSEGPEVNDEVYVITAIVSPSEERMKPPKRIDLNTWFRKYCTYEILIAPNGIKFHAFWLPQRLWARIWRFRSNTGDYPEMEISLKQVVEEGWGKE